MDVPSPPASDLPNVRPGAAGLRSMEVALEVGWAPALPALRWMGDGEEGWATGLRKVDAAIFVGWAPGLERRLEKTVVVVDCWATGPLRRPGVGLDVGCVPELLRSPGGALVEDWDLLPVGCGGGGPEARSAVLLPAVLPRLREDDRGDQSAG